jgi:hypothetical protein
VDKTTDPVTRFFSPVFILPEMRLSKERSSAYQRIEPKPQKYNTAVSKGVGGGATQGLGRRLKSGCDF